MNEPYFFEKAIGQQMGDLCRLAVGDDRVTQTGEIVTLEDMLGRGSMGVSVEVPYKADGVGSLKLTRCGKNLLPILVNSYTYGGVTFQKVDGMIVANGNIQNANAYFYFAPGFVLRNGTYFLSGCPSGGGLSTYRIRIDQPNGSALAVDSGDGRSFSVNDNWGQIFAFVARYYNAENLTFKPMITMSSQSTPFEPYNGNIYTISLPADFYGGSIDLEAGTATSRYAADGTELAEPVVTEIDPISIPILAGVNNIWADAGTVTVSYYRADEETFRPALWYSTIYRGLTSARYIIKSASGAVASFDDAIAAPLVGLRVTLPWNAEGYNAVEVTVNGTATAITLPTTIYGGYLDAVTGHLVATHDANGNLLANQKLYFLPPTNVSALAGANSVWSDAGGVTVSYRVEQ